MKLRASTVTMAVAVAVAMLTVTAVSATAADITVTDDFGRSVTVAAPAQRIISLAPHITENLFSAGAGARVVAVVDHSDYPPAAGRIPSLGNYAQFSLEALIALAPDLVVAWRTAKSRDKLERLERLGFALFYSEPRDFDAIIANIEKFARLADTRPVIDPARLRARLAGVRTRYADAETLTVFYQIWREPLMTLGGGHFISRVLEVCGARNLFAGGAVLAPRVNIEAVVQADPDIIIGGAPDAFELWRRWPSMRAVSGRGLLTVDGDVMHRHTARMLMGVGDVCESIDQVRRR